MFTSFLLCIINAKVSHIAEKCCKYVTLHAHLVCTFIFLERELSKISRLSNFLRSCSRWFCIWSFNMYNLVSWCLSKRAFFAYPDGRVLSPNLVESGLLHSPKPVERDKKRTKSDFMLWILDTSPSSIKPVTWVIKLSITGILCFLYTKLSDHINNEFRWL